MKLHLDKPAFEYIIDEIATTHQIRRDVLEKDYYVTLLLQELAQLPNQGYAYFKGGTALYKALKSIRRFSEDIDLTVYVEDCPTNSQAQKRLEKATLHFGSMPKGQTLENNRGSITCEYIYQSMYSLDQTDLLQRFGRVKVEATSFTVSEPTEYMEIAPHLYELSNEQNRAILRDTYDVNPFAVKTISLERIFVDKIFATQFYFERKEYGDVAKHVYDITVLMGLEQIQRFLCNVEEVKRIVSFKRKEELSRKGGVSADKKVAQFDYFTGLQNDKEFDAKFAIMQKVYVFDLGDVLSKEDVLNSLLELQQKLSLDC